MSAKRTVAPASRIAFSVATNVNGSVITSSPGCRSSTCSAAISAVVPLFTATAWATAGQLGELALELGHHRALGEEAGAQDLEHQVLGALAEVND